MRFFNNDLNRLGSRLQTTVFKDRDLDDTRTDKTLKTLCEEMGKGSTPVEYILTMSGCEHFSVNCVIDQIWTE